MTKNESPRVSLLAVAAFALSTLALAARASDPPNWDPAESERAGARYREERCMDLIAAAGRGDIVGIRNLVTQNETDPSCRASGPTTPLGNAVENDQAEAARYLLALGADPDAQQYWGYRTPLSHAAEIGSRDMLEVLLASKADPNLKPRRGDPALIAAVTYCREAAVERLLEVGASPHALAHPKFIPAEGEVGANAAILAMNCGDPSLVRLIRSKGVPLRDERRYQSVYCEAAGWSDEQTRARLDLLDLAYGDGSPVNASGGDFTPLGCAILNGNYPLAKFLLSRGADASKACRGASRGEWLSAERMIAQRAPYMLSGVKARYEANAPLILALLPVK